MEILAMFLQKMPTLFMMTFITSRLVNLWEKKLGKGYQR